MVALEVYPGISLDVDTKISTFKNNTFLQNFRGPRGSLLQVSDMPFVRIINNIYSSNRDVLLEQFGGVDIQNDFGAFRPTPQEQMYRSAPGSNIQGTGAIITITTGHGFEIKGDKIEENNWKDDFSFQQTAQYLHTYYTPGKFKISEMEVTSPPTGVCSSVAQSFVTNQAIYQSKCGSSTLPHQSYQPFFKFQFFNDAAYSAEEYQTDFDISFFSLSNLHKPFGFGSPFIEFNAAQVYSMIHLNLTSITIITALQNTDYFLDLRGIITDINGLVLQNLGDISKSAEYIFRLGDQANTVSANRFTIQNVALESVYATKSTVILESQSNGQINVNLSNFYVFSSYGFESLFTIDAAKAKIKLEGWNVNGFTIGNITSTLYYEFILTEYTELSIIGFTHVCSLFHSHCRVLWLNNQLNTLTITDSDFSMEESNGASVAASLKSSPFKIVCKELILARNQIHGYQGLGEQGGVFQGIISHLTDTNSYYYQNKGGELGGVFHLTRTSQSNFTNSHFYNNAATNGGVFQLYHFITLTLNNCSFYGNHAQNSGGSLRVFGSSVAKVYNSSFYGNTANNEGAVMFILSSESQNDFSIIQDSSIYRNRLPVGRNPITVLYSEVVFKNVSFYENLAIESSHNMYIGFSEVNFTDCRFFVEDEYFQYFFQYEETHEFIVVNSVGISIGENADVNIQNTTFSTTSGQAPMINVQGYSQLIINNSDFRNLQGEFGSAIQASSFERINVTNSYFFNNEASIHGSDIFIANTNSPIFIHNSTFASSIGTSIYLSDGEMYVTQSLFTQQDYAIVPGGKYVIDCSNCVTLSIESSNFTELNVDSVLHIQNSSLLAHLEMVQALMNVKDSRFQNITYAQNGGAITVDNYDFVLLDGNIFDSISNFQNISTSQQLKGGAIYTEGQDLRNVRLKGNIFRYCEAHIGGAIYYAHHQPQIESDNTFVNNMAQIYGDDIAAYPVKLGFATEAALTRSLTYFDFTSQYSSYSVQGDGTLDHFQFLDVQSGGTLSTFYVVVLDKFGQIVRSQSNNRLTVTLEVNHISSYSPVASLSADLYCQNGIFNVTGLSTIAEPGTSVGVKIGAVDLFDSSLPDVASFQSSNGQSLDLTTTLTTRTCLPGQAFLANGQCLACSNTEYKLEASTVPTNCLACPQRANCFGGSTIGPKPTYWRASSTSVNFQSCLNPDACLGRLSPSDSELGNCAEGYRGILCGQCQENYSRDSQFRCVGCPKPWRNILFITLISLVSLAGIVLLVKFTISSARSQKSPFSIYMKVLINHLQLVFLTSSFDLSWPQQVETFYAQTRPVATVGDQILSLDCLLAQSTIQQIGRFYVYLLAYLIMPIFVAFLSLLFWWFKIRSDKKRICNRSTATIIIILFLLHPSITNTIFNAFYCRDVDGTLRLVQQLDEVCWEGKHFWWALFGGFPGLLCWAVGIPGFAWLVLSEHKQQLGNAQMKEKFGFLYKGYKLDSFYWECVIMYRKVAMIFISVFLNGIGTMVQALVVIMLLVFFIVITLRKKPYYSRKLNDLEMVSLVTSCVTFYCGLYFLSSKSPSDPSYISSKDFFLGEYSKWFFFCVIVFANLCFFVFWLFSFLGEARHKLRERCTRLYVCLCLCCRRGLLKEDRRNAKQEEAQELVIETIEQLERSLKSVRNMYIARKDFVDRNKFEVMAFKFNREMQKVDMNDLLHGEEKTKSAYLGKVRVTPSSDPLFYLPENKERRKERERIENQNDLQILAEEFEENRSADVMVIDQDPQVLKKTLQQCRTRSKPYEEFVTEAGTAKRGPPSPQHIEVRVDERNLYDSVNSSRTFKTFNTSKTETSFARHLLPRQPTQSELRVEVEDMFLRDDIFYKFNSGLPILEEEEQEEYSEGKSVRENYQKLRKSASHLKELRGHSTQTVARRKKSKKKKIHPEDILESEDNYQAESANLGIKSLSGKPQRHKVAELRSANSTTNKLRNKRYAENGANEEIEEVNPLTTQDLSHLVHELQAVPLQREETPQQTLNDNS